MATAPSLTGSSQNLSPLERSIITLQDRVERDALDPLALQYLQYKVQGIVFTSMKIQLDVIKSTLSMPINDDFSVQLDKLLLLSNDIGLRNLHAQEASQLVSQMKKAAKHPPTFKIEDFEYKMQGLAADGADPRLIASLRDRLAEFQVKAEEANTPSMRALKLAHDFLEAAKHPESFSPADFEAEIDALEAQNASPTAIALLREALRQAAGPAPEASPYASAEEEDEPAAMFPLPSDVPTLIKILNEHRTDAQAAMAHIQTLSPGVKTRIENLDPSSTPEIRERSIQRTLVWTLLTLLKESVADQSKVNGYLDILDGLKLDARDLPSGKRNLAHYLYERLYYTYKEEADQSGSGLLSPHDRIFKGDFGRAAFRGVAGAVDCRFLEKTLGQVYDEIVDRVWNQDRV